jgi:hypothetical protein
MNAAVVEAREDGKGDLNACNVFIRRRAFCSDRRLLGFPLASGPINSTCFDAVLDINNSAPQIRVKDGLYFKMSESTLLYPAMNIQLKRLYHNEDNYLLIFCVFSRDRSSNISQEYKLRNF